jgi:DNA-binding transcriptional LysR family regulator
MIVVAHQSVSSAYVLAGIGLGTFPDCTVRDDIAQGRRVRMFSDWTLRTGGIHVVFPPARFRPAKVRAFVDLLVAAERKRARSSIPG